MEQVVATQKANDRNDLKMRKRESSRKVSFDADNITETSHDNVEVVATGFKVSAINELWYLPKLRRHKQKR